MDDLIEESSSADDAARSKPYPDIFAATLGKLGVAADRAIALGDTPTTPKRPGNAVCGPSV